MRARLVVKGFDRPVVDSVIDALSSLGLLNDRELAVSLKRYAAESKQLGFSGTRRFLRERGIPEEIIDETLQDIDETEGARKIVERKMRGHSGHPSRVVVRRLYGFLSRRGYAPETIRKALQQFHPEEGF